MTRIFFGFVNHVRWNTDSAIQRHRTMRIPAIFQFASLLEFWGRSKTAGSLSAVTAPGNSAFVFVPIFF